MCLRKKLTYRCGHRFDWFISFLEVMLFQIWGWIRLGLCGFITQSLIVGRTSSITFSIVNKSICLHMVNGIDIVLLIKCILNNWRNNRGKFLLLRNTSTFGLRCHLLLLNLEN